MSPDGLSHPSSASPAKANEQTPGKGLLQAPSFPQGSIGSEQANAAWRHGASNDNYRYHGDDGTYASIGKNMTLWQDFQLPDDTVAVAYGVGCEYGFSLFAKCELKIYRLEASGQESLLQTRELPGEGTVEGNTQDDTAVTWHTVPFMEVPASTGVRHLRVKFVTPDGGGNPWLYLRRVHLSLIQPAFNGQEAVSLIVDPDGEAIQCDVPPFPLCHGASHQLQVRATDNAAWVGQKFSLLWREEGESPIQYGLRATPPFNLDASDDLEHYQDLPPVGHAQWVLTAAGEQQDTSGDLALGLGSYWSAPIYPIEAKVGDFRFKVAELEWDGVIPIVELNNKATLTAKVINPYASLRLPAGKEVIWSLNGSEYRRTQTDEQGEATLEYQAKAGEEGANNRVEFTAGCLDEFELASAAQLILPVYLKTPWLEELDVLLDGEPVTEFENTGVFLARGTEHTLTLKPKCSDSFFIGKGISLRWPREGEPQLGIAFTPTTEREMPAMGVEWRLTGGDASGLFTLDVMLAGLDVPLTLKGAQLSANLLDEAELLLDDQPVAPESTHIFRRNDSRKLTLQPKMGSPLSTLGVDAWVSFEKGSLDQGSMPATPTYESKRELLANGLAWSMTGAQVSGDFGLRLHISFKQFEMRIKCLLISTVLADEVMLAFDGIATKADVSLALRYNTAHTLFLLPKSTSPLSGSGLPIWLRFEAGSLTEDKIKAQPAYGERRELETGWLRWSLTGEDLSGTFTLSIHLQDDIDNSIRFPGSMLLSLSTSDEFEFLRLNDEPLHVFYKMQGDVIRLEPKRDSPLYGTEPPGILKFVQSGRIRERDVSAAPNFGVLTNGRAQWQLTPNNFLGGFGLEASAPGFTLPITLDCVVVSWSFEETFYVTLNDIKMYANIPATFRGQETNTLEAGLIYPSEMISLGANVWLEFVGKSSSSGVVSAVPDFGFRRELLDQSLVWSLNYSGPRPIEFELRLMSDLPETSCVYKFRVLGGE